MRWEDNVYFHNSKPVQGAGWLSVRAAWEGMAACGGAYSSSGDLPFIPEALLSAGDRDRGLLIRSGCYCSGFNFFLTGIPQLEQ